MLDRCYGSGQLRLLVTGAAGFIGSNFLRMVSDGEFRGMTNLKVLDKLTYAGVRGNLEGIQNIPGYSFIQGDICDVELVNSLIGDVDAIVNFAAESDVDRSIFGS